jgi:predicted nucleotidyltransferase
LANSAAEGFRVFIDWQIPSAADRAKASSHRAAIEVKLEQKYGLYRMFQSGSFSHGTGVKNFSDVDYFVSLKSDKPQLSYSILNSVKATLQERFPFTTIRVARPAVVLDFGGGYETVEIIPAFASQSVNDDVMKFQIPGVATEWLESAPEAHVKYVNGCNQLPSYGKAKSFIRLVKAWKFYMDVPVSSFYLEMRAANYIARQTSVNYAYDLSIFFNELLSADLADMNDPTGTTGRIRACSTDYNKQLAIKRLETAAGRARNALIAHRNNNDSQAFYYWDLLFGGHFPAYS